MTTRNERLHQVLQYPNFVQSFITRVNRLSDSGRCWLWQGSIVPNEGYGQLRLNGENYRAHRISWTLRHQRPIPEGMVICHTCDNPPCVNPNHLFLGDDFDNMGDASHKGRVVGPTWEQQHRLDGEAQNIKDLYASGNYTHQEIADYYGVSRSCISDILRGRRRASD